MGDIDKLLLAVNGQPMVRRSARLYLDLGMKLTVVTGSDDRAIAAALAGLGLQLVANPAADNGQQTSVHAGLAATALQAPGVIVALADQPLLTLHDITALLTEFAAHAGTRICIPRFNGQRGNPVIFPAAIARILREQDAMSPRDYLDAHPREVAWFEVNNDHFTRDIDTPADAAELLGAAVDRIPQAFSGQPMHD